ncbi:18725_t:CDS:2, partial [Racocetra persica]
LTCKIGTLRDNFKMAEAESSRNAIKMNDAIDKRNHTERKYNFAIAQHKRELRRRDERENDLHSQITLLRNRIQELESLLDEREIDLSLLRNRIQELESLLNI